MRDLDEDLLVLRQLELRVMAQEMALIAKRLGAQASTPPEHVEHVHQLEHELHQTRAHHAAVWRHVCDEQRRRYHHRLAIFTSVGLGLVGLAFALSVNTRDPSA